VRQWSWLVVQMGELQRRYRQGRGQDHLSGQWKVTGRMPELTQRSPSFPGQVKKRPIKHGCEYLRQTYNAIFNPNTRIRNSSVVQRKVIILLSFHSHLHLPGAAKWGLEDRLLRAAQNGLSSSPSLSVPTNQQATLGTGALQTSSSDIFLSDRPALGPTNPWQTCSQFSNGFS